MHTLYEKIVHASENMIHVIDLFHGRICDIEIRIIPGNLKINISAGNFHRFHQIFSTFIKYIRNNRKKSCSTLEFITLHLYFCILNAPQGKFPIGGRILHNNKTAYITDYLHQLDLYEIQYTDASVFSVTHGWVKYNVLHKL